jgi:ribosomal protein S6--L-glutamate ligase
MECDLLIEDGEYKVVYEHEYLMKPDYVIPRIGSSVTFYGSTVVRHFQKMGVPILSTSEGIVNSRDKFRSLQLLSESGIKIPKTYFSNDLYYADRIVNNLLGYPFIMKVLEGTQGEGVYLIKDADEAARLFSEHIRKRTKVILQEYIAEFSGKDIRVIVVLGEVVASMMRIAQEGEFRSNIHKGGKGVIVQLSEKEKEMSIRALEILGLGFGGVDILRSEQGSMIIEVNSSPGLEGIEEATKIRIAEKLIESIVNSI